MRPRKRSLHELPYTEIAKSGTLVWIIEAMGAHYHPSSIADLVGLEAKGLELDLAVLLVHRVAVEVHVAGHVKVYPEHQVHS